MLRRLFLVIAVVALATSPLVAQDPPAPMPPLPEPAPPPFAPPSERLDTPVPQAEAEEAERPEPGGETAMDVVERMLLAWRAKDTAEMRECMRPQDSDAGERELAAIVRMIPVSTAEVIEERLDDGADGADGDDAKGAVLVFLTGRIDPDEFREGLLPLLQEQFEQQGQDAEQARQMVESMIDMLIDAFIEQFADAFYSRDGHWVFVERIDGRWYIEDMNMNGDRHPDDPGQSERVDPEDDGGSDSDGRDSDGRDSDGRDG